MKKLILSAAMLTVLFIGSSFITSYGSAQDDRKLDSFVGIGISIHADVFYTQGNSHEIKIEGDEKDIQDLITKVDDGVLKVRYDKPRIKRSKLTIYITSQELEAIRISGSALFKADKAVSSEEMDLTISGSGKIIFSELKSEEVDVRISGSGDAVLEKGVAEELSARISGSGKMLAENFEVSEASITISGSGSCWITANDELDARLSGSGKVNYHGDPQVDAVSSGSGKVRAL